MLQKYNAPNLKLCLKFPCTKSPVPQIYNMCTKFSCTNSPCTKSLMPQISYASDFSLCTKFLRICTKSLIVPQISHASNLPCTKSLIVHQISVHQISHAPNCMHQIGFTKSDSPNFPAPNRIERGQLLVYLLYTALVGPP